MLKRATDGRWSLLFLPLLSLATGCDINGPVPIEPVPPPPDAGNDAGPCGEDCSLIETPPCSVAVCNTGQVIGPLNTCIVVPAVQGTACDDGLFCTLGDTCDGNGACAGGPPNRCGLKLDPCLAVTCYEQTKTCDTLPMGEGDPCTPEETCRINGVCKVGKCVGEPKDCSFSPFYECNAVSCNPATGKCEPTPDANKDNAPCVLTGNLCNINKVCQAGQCVGGTPKDCSGLDFGCRIGACNPENGLCTPSPAAAGTLCSEGITECHVGNCDNKGVCVASVAPDNSPCNDYYSCTEGDTCASGTCMAGTAVSMCADYLHDGFENCSNGWTFGGDWECGKPVNEGPQGAYLGTTCIGTNIDGLYSVNQSYNAAVATTPAIDLTQATSPMVSFWAWVHTEGGSFDGFNLKISTDGGQSFTTVTTVTPAYPLSIVGQPAWGGDLSLLDWQHYQADLSAYAGQTVQLRFSFRSDGATVYPGVYIDEVVVAEPAQIPMHITTTSPLEDIYSGMAYSKVIERLGGSPNAEWSIEPGSQNTGWLSINPMTGELYGTPSATDVGPVLAIVRVKEPMLPSNFSERAFSFNVKANLYYTSFEGMCPGDWTLTGDWECGVPSMPPNKPSGQGPATAYIGTQCLATQIDDYYNNLQTWVGTTATSPEIDLTNAVGPTMSFRMWLDTEGATYDGVNLQVSNDGGMSYSVIAAVSPPYPLIIVGKPAWGGHQFAQGWQFMQADLSPYAGQKIRLRFAFQSDSSGTFPGVYIDDIFIDD